MSGSKNRRHIRSRRGGAHVHATAHEPIGARDGEVAGEGNRAMKVMDAMADAKRRIGEFRSLVDGLGIDATAPCRA